MHSLDAHEKPN